MKVVFAIAAVLLIAAVYSVHLPKEPMHFTQPIVEAHWQGFLTKFNRTYETPQEYAMRREIFRMGLIRASQMNVMARGKTQFGVTKFSDMTPEEFKSQVLMNNPPAIDYEKLRAHYTPMEIDESTVPEDKTYVGTGYITPVYNQEQCGSCWAFSATEQMETMWYVKHNQLNSLSMQQIVDCDTQAYGCGGGWTYSAYEYIMSAPGQDSFRSYPYTAANGQCQFSTSNVISNIASWKYITQSADETEMKNYIGTTAPLSICADAQPWQYYTGGVFMASQCGQSIDHCIQLVGYKMSASTPYWIVRNSWGADWGENGMIWLEYGQNTCAMGNVVTTVEAASSA